MAWAWGNPIDDTTDMHDVALWNTLLAAVHERGKVSLNPLGNDWLNPAPAITPGLPDVRYPVVFGHQDDFLKQGGFVWPAGANGWLHKSLYEMQQVLEGVQIWMLNRQDYPAGLEGVSQFIPANAAFDMRGDLLADKLGYHAAEPNPDDPFGHPLPRLWRRKSPRKIISLTATHNHLNTVTPCPIGSLAQLFQFSAYFNYRGVYQLRAGGTWNAPDDLTLGADVLDSDLAYNAAGWMPPGRFGIIAPEDGFSPVGGVYYEPRLLRDIVAACKLFTWRYFNANINTISHIEGGSATTAYPSAAAAEAAAIAQLTANVAANDTTYISGINRLDDVGTFLNNFPAGSDNWYAMARTARVTLKVPIQYKNISRAVDWYMAGTPFNVFNAQGTAMLNNVCHKFGTSLFPASGHLWGDDVSPVLIDYPIPNAWNVGLHTGFTIDGESITKFDFTYQ